MNKAWVSGEKERRVYKEEMFKAGLNGVIKLNMWAPVVLCDYCFA